MPKRILVNEPVGDSKARKTSASVEGECSDESDTFQSPYFLANKPQPKRKQDNLFSRLPDTFYNQPCLSLATALLGKIVVHEVGGVRLSGRIVEVECYLGGPDVASHSYGGKKTQRNEPMYMAPGTAYVYHIYGMYFCFNISSLEKGACVLIRALEPLENIGLMIEKRNVRRKSLKPLKPQELCNGPSKLCQALGIDKESCNKIYMPDSLTFWLENSSSIPKENIVISKRIGIESSGEEWANKPLRFYVKDSLCVSVKDKKAEAAMGST
ncbi:uncharacterized protein LOC143038624 [Oratosquilla oratoria]|uniref:uncharacterized protein LOC143038624 n=1 Tax=Oratosquilla oratoria TaxID=337810 RepID=UPI003F76D3DA